LLTDYRDGQTTEETNEIIRLHCAECKVCQAFCADIGEFLDFTVSSTSDAAVPEHLWGTIKTAIETEKTRRKRNLFPDLLERITDTISHIRLFPRPVFAYVSVLLVIGVLVFTTMLFPVRQKDGIDDFLSDQIIYLASLDQEVSETDGSHDFGSVIEQYFL
jgi:hypothetical protein